MPDAPLVFLCHASEDKPLARRLAHEFQRNGIETFFDEWEIRAGDSIRRKIDDGLERCTHLVALLTPASIRKPWVQEEMDVAFMMKVEGECRFIPVRHDLSAVELPPLLRGVLSPQLEDFEADAPRLISDIYEVSRRPPLGSGPVVVENESLIDGLGLELSPAAVGIVQMIVLGSETGTSVDPVLQVETIQQELGLTAEDIEDSVGELEEGFWVNSSPGGPGPLAFDSLYPTDDLFVDFDSHFMPWDPLVDALTIAADLVNSEEGGEILKAIAERNNWSPRRINPAARHLIRDELGMSDESAGTDPYTCHWLRATSRTRRFVREKESNHT